MSSESQLGRALIAETSRRLFDESLVRLKTCLDLLTEDEIWFRASEETVSAGNLVLHLCGNVHQWIVCALGGRVDQRQRADEFAFSGRLSRSDLLARLDAVMSETRTVLAELDPDSLCAPRQVQCFNESGVSILVHVVEHFSYHVGQVTFIVKAHAGKRTDYYAGRNLDATGGATS